MLSRRSSVPNPSEVASDLRDVLLLDTLPLAGADTFMNEMGSEISTTVT